MRMPIFYPIRLLTRCSRTVEWCDLSISLHLVIVSTCFINPLFQMMPETPSTEVASISLDNGDLLMASLDSQIKELETQIIDCMAAQRSLNDKITVMSEVGLQLFRISYQFSIYIR